MEQKFATLEVTHVDGKPIKKKAVKKKKPEYKKIKFDLKKLSNDIFEKRRKENLSFLQAAKVSGIGRPQMYVLERGNHIPSCKTFAAAINWLQKPANDYFHH